MTSREFWQPKTVAKVLYLLRRGLPVGNIAERIGGISAGELGAFLEEKGYREGWTNLPGVSPCPYRSLVEFYAANEEVVDREIRELAKDPRYSRGLDEETEEMEDER